MKVPIRSRSPNHRGILADGGGRMPLPNARRFSMFARVAAILTSSQVSPRVLPPRFFA